MLIMAAVGLFLREPYLGERKVGEDEQDHSISRAISWLLSPRLHIVVSLVSRRMLDRRPLTNGSDLGCDDIRHIGSCGWRRGSVDLEVPGKSARSPSCPASLRHPMVVMDKV